MIVKQCDLCGQIRDCLLKEIDGKEYDICLECWSALEEKLHGKGRSKDRERVYLPRPVRTEKQEPEKPHPGEPPKIWCHSEKVQ